MSPSLGKRIREAREALGLTQEQLAKPDLTKGFISHIERSKSGLSVQNLERLAQRLGRPVSYFLGDGDARLAKKVLTALGDRGRSDLTRERYDGALAAFAEMCALATAQRDVAMEAHALVGRGEALAGLARFDEAKTYLSEALGRARKTADSLAECRALASLGRVEQNQGNFTRAEWLYSAALGIVQALDPEEPDLHGDILLLRSSVLLRMGRLEEASEGFIQGQRVFEDAQLPERVGEALVDHGLALYLIGDYDEALLRLERACVLLERYEDLPTLSWAHNNLGMVLLEIAKPREAVEHFTVSLAVKRRLNDAHGESHTLTELARCHVACGEMEPARDHAQQAIALSRTGGAPDEEPRAQIVLGAIAIAEGNAREARRYLTLAAAYCERSHMKLELVTALRGLARVTALQGRYRESAGYHDRAMIVLQGMGPQDATAAIRHADLVGHWIDRAKVGHRSS